MSGTLFSHLAWALVCDVGSTKPWIGWCRCRLGELHEIREYYTHANSHEIEHADQGRKGPGKQYYQHTGQRHRAEMIVTWRDDSASLGDE